MRIFLYSLLCFFAVNIMLSGGTPKVIVGADLLFSEPYVNQVKGKKIGLITNHTAVNRQMQSTIDMLKTNSKKHGYALIALFAPEHGITGASHASEQIEDEKDTDGLPIYSLHGKHRRPTPQMLKGINLLIYDIQDIGSRSYTFSTTLYYVMEEAAKLGIPVIVLDRPNPINGRVIDGPMLEDKWRSMVGYINVPYCHGMTIAELAQFFNKEYKIGCDLSIVPMRGWQRKMSFQDTGLHWIPTSPNIPEATTAFFYPTTGLIGELNIVNIGIGFTMPFKLIGAPWINAKKLAAALNQQKFQGVQFEPFYYKPFYGRFSHEECEGVLIVITDPLTYKPVSTQYLIIGILKGLYPEKFKEALASSKNRKEMFCKVNGTEEVYRMMMEDKNIVWKLRTFQEKLREAFLPIRSKYLIPDYEN